MESPITGREWTRLLKHLDIFGTGMDHVATDSAAPEMYHADGRPVQQGAGWIEVIDHQVMIWDGENELVQPWIKAQAPVVLLVNGQMITEAIQVHGKDKIEIRFEPTPMFEVTVSEDRVKVMLRIHRDHQLALRLANASSAYELTLTAEPIEGQITDKLTLEKIMSEIAAQKIQVVVKEVVIRSELNLGSGEEIVIAEGVEPVFSIDARLEKFFLDEIQNDFVQADDRDRVDFRSHLKIPSVKPGELMARLHPPIPGKNGMDVYGAPIVPAPPRNYVIKGRHHVNVMNGLEVYATKGGRPLVKGEDILEFEVVPCFEWNGNVDFRSGNIFFDGDVVINGSVMEAMAVEASGRITVNGSIYRAMVISTHSVIVNGKVINGSVYAGEEPPHFKQLRQVTNDIHEQWTQWLQTARYVMNRLRKAGQPVRRGPLLMSIIQTKFVDMPRRIKLWLTLQQQLTPSADSPLMQMAEALRGVMSPGFWSEDGSMEKLEWMEQKLYDCSLPPGGNLIKANITLDQCQLSDLRASGDIMVRKEGAIQSNMVAEDNIIFTDVKAICRGGQVIAGGRIVCGALGSDSGSHTMVKAGKEIVANQMIQGRIYIGRHMREIWSPIRKMKAYIDHNALVVTGMTD